MNYTYEPELNLQILMLINCLKEIHQTESEEVNHKKKRWIVEFH